jgi:nucleotide-binding universal stress UspA family protein
MHKRILLALDGSTMAEQALGHAVEQAKRFRSELILLRAIGPSLQSGGLSTMELGWVQEQMGDWARDYLQSIATQVRAQGVPVRVVVVQDPAHKAITRFAETNDVDLIVICSRGQSGPSRWMMGSVADRVVRGATTPVLLVQAVGNGRREISAGRIAEDEFDRFSEEEKGLRMSGWMD